MLQTPDSGSGPSQAGVYQIRIKGHLGPTWGDWFDQMTITAEVNGETLLTGPIVDQAELHGVLRKIRDLGISLISFAKLTSSHDDIVEASQCHETPHESESSL